MMETLFNDSSLPVKFLVLTGHLQLTLVPSLRIIVPNIYPRLLIHLPYDKIRYQFLENLTINFS